MLSVEVVQVNVPQFLQEFRVVFWEPCDQEVETTFAVVGADTPAPLRPALHKRTESQHADNFLVGGILQQAGGSPIPIQASFGCFCPRESPENHLR